MMVHDDYRRRLIAAAETDAVWYPNLTTPGGPMRRTARSASGEATSIETRCQYNDHARGVPDAPVEDSGPYPDRLAVASGTLTP
jgi:hypothetical protein